MAMGDDQQRVLILTAGAAGVAALLASSKKARVLALAGVTAAAVYRFTSSRRDPWRDVQPPRAR